MENEKEKRIEALKNFFSKDEQKLVGSFAYPAQEDFDSNQNLIGLFSILLQVDKRINPQNYQDNKKKYDRYSNSSNS